MLNSEIKDEGLQSTPAFAKLPVSCRDNGLSLSTLFDELKDDPDAYIYDETDLEEFLEIYDN